MQHKQCKGKECKINSGTKIRNEIRNLISILTLATCRWDLIHAGSFLLFARLQDLINVTRKQGNEQANSKYAWWSSSSMCVCMCVFVRERERDGEIAHIIGHATANDQQSREISNELNSFLCRITDFQRFFLRGTPSILVSLISQQISLCLLRQ